MSTSEKDVHPKCVTFFKMGRHVADLKHLHLKLILQRASLLGKVSVTDETIDHNSFYDKMHEIELDILLKPTLDLEDCADGIACLYSKLLKTSLGTTESLSP